MSPHLIVSRWEGDSVAPTTKSLDLSGRTHVSFYVEFLSLATGVDFEKPKLSLPTRHMVSFGRTKCFRPKRSFEVEETNDDVREETNGHIRYDKSQGRWIQHRKVVSLLVQFLKHAERDDRYEVDWSHYKSWGGRETAETKFDVVEGTLE